ncbi:MAG: polysaccharide-degrading enzyme [Candidatus Limnocylindria bacterium]
MKRAFARVAALVLVAAVVPAGARAAVHEVGPGQALAAIGDVPWESLAPGDEVRIHWRPEPYREKWVIGRAGTAAAPIVVRGIPGPGGERPVVSGDGATTPDPLDFTNDARGVIKIGTSNVPSNTLPAHIVIEGVEVRSAHPSYSFTDDRGAAQTYSNNAAAIYVERGQHLVIRDCVLSDSGNGLFIGAFDGDTQDIRIERNWIRGNGIVGSGFEHNTYTAAIGIVYEANRFGPLRAGAGGNNLKDRSAGLVVRFNWIEGGNRQLDLVDAEDSDLLVNHPSYGETFVYGNLLIEPDGAGNSQIVHYGGDSGATEIYRKGILHFFHNTIVSLRSGNTTLFRLSTNDESADVRNNLFYVAASGNRLALLDAAGVVALSHNWTKPGWVASHGGLSGVIDDDGSGVEGASPGFTDAAMQDFHLVEESEAVDAGSDLHPDVLPDHAVAAQYREHQMEEPRPADGAPDLGAFELPEPGVDSGLAAGLVALGLLSRHRRRCADRAG